jgi:hypothetical protein
LIELVGLVIRGEIDRTSDFSKCDRFFFPNNAKDNPHIRLLITCVEISLFAKPEFHEAGACDRRVDSQ